MLHEAILALLVSLQGDLRDRETEEERLARMTTISHGIQYAVEGSTCSDHPYEDCDREWLYSEHELAALLVTIGYHETRFARHVHEGQCMPHECDAVRMPGGGVYHRARSSWQMHRISLVRGDEWAEMLGTSLHATRTAATVAARILSFSAMRCGSIEGAISSYATGTTCRWSGAAPRMRTYRRFLKRITESSAQQVD
jgi:hypothetical protein